MSFLMWVGCYLIAMILFYISDGWFGYFDDMSENDRNYIFWICLFWIIFIPLGIIFSLHGFLNNIKKKRIKKQQQKEKIRIADLKELDQLEEELTQELKINRG